MLFEDLTADDSVDETAEASSEPRMTLLDAFWQDVLTCHREVEPPALERPSPLPVADRELAIDS